MCSISFWADSEIFLMCQIYWASAWLLLDVADVWCAWACGFHVVGGEGESTMQEPNTKSFLTTCFVRLKTFLWGWWYQSKWWSWTQTLYFLNVPTFWFYLYLRLRTNNFFTAKAVSVLYIHLCRFCTKTLIQGGADYNFTYFENLHMR